MSRHFISPVITALVALGAVFFFGGTAAFFTAALLVLLEVTLSFDNAVVNAKVLMKMTPRWQQRFLTWGMIIAVLGTRLVLPVLIVSAAAWVSPFLIAQLAFFSPAEYGALLSNAHELINAFGAVFLLMISLKYFLDEEKKIHWIHFIERHLTIWGRVEALEIFIGLAVLTALSFLVPGDVRAMVLTAGIIGMILFIAMEGIVSAFSIETKGQEKASAAGQGLALFIYLNILDSAFSLDGVVGAFALTSSILAIVVGLGVGAYFVRSLTVYLVEKRSLESLLYLEHGAHWAIFGLAASMFTSLLIPVPEIITGTIGMAFVLAAYYSSLRLNGLK